ncbi:MAG: bifunctional folylpolyglutamate synthase/dihydrofolate synthase [Verrucomicrobia bacterium]|nr:bifunctional folylpolyglutamate synthase/dihydrofolate synthase [Verrucomicrobiota bacterium]
MTYADDIQFLYDLRWFGAKLGLENTFKLAALAGNPQNKLRFIHVAGTNGKGSTCAMLESIYRAAGLRVGLFTSPHLVSFSERIQVNRQLIAESEVARLVEEMRGKCSEFRLQAASEPARAGTPNADDAHPTFFEVVTVMALRYFAEQKCDIVIWETGMGGRLDATNIVTPLACVITNVQLDHQQWLGETVEAIAFEKAGIIKPGVLVSTAVDTTETLKVLLEVARERNAPLNLITWTQTERQPMGDLELPLLGEHQRLNAALAVNTVRKLAAQIPVSDETIRQGLRSLSWPGRLQLIKRDSGRNIILDAAHNPAGAESLVAALQKYFPSTQPTLILGVLRDKDCARMCEILVPWAGRVLLVPVKSERSATPWELITFCQQANPQAEVRACCSLDEALRLAADDAFTVITGSLYLVGEAMELLKLAAAPSGDEKGLNEWSGQR